RFRVEPLCKRSRVREVAEDRGHGLARRRSGLLRRRLCDSPGFSARRLIELGILAKDAMVEVSQFAPGLEAELLDERRAGHLIRLEGPRGGAGWVEREHERSRERLAMGIGKAQSPQPADELRVVPGRKVAVDPQLEARRGGLVAPPRLDLREAEVSEICERR